MRISGPNKLFEKRQLLSSFNRKIDFDYSADHYAKRSLEKLDRSSKDINELIDTLEVLITDFNKQNKKHLF